MTAHDKDEVRVGGKVLNFSKAKWSNRYKMYDCGGGMFFSKDYPRIKRLRKAGIIPDPPKESR